MKKYELLQKIEQLEDNTLFNIDKMFIAILAIFCILLVLVFAHLMATGSIIMLIVPIGTFFLFMYIWKKISQKVVINTKLDKILLFLNYIAFLIPIIWIVTATYSYNKYIVSFQKKYIILSIFWFWLSLIHYMLGWYIDVPILFTYEYIQASRIFLIYGWLVWGYIWYNFYKNTLEQMIENMNEIYEKEED